MPDSGTALKAALDDIGAGRVKPALKAADTVLRNARAADDRQAIAAAQLIRAMALEALERRDEAHQAARASIDTTERPEVGLGLIEFLTQIGDADTAQDVLTRYLDRFGFRARDLEPDTIFPLLNWIRDKQGKPAWEALTIRLANGGFGGDDLETRDMAALRAARILAGQGKLDEARALAGGIVTRGTMISALTDRHYESLWPLLEQSAGPHLERIGRAAVIEAEGPGKAKDASSAARLSLFRAYRDAGLYDEADTFAAAFAATPDDRARLDLHGAWLVNDHALLLERRGKVDQGDSRFADLTASLPIAEHGWLISMVINRVDSLVAQRRDAAALALVDAAIAQARTYGSPYAQQLLRAHRICALHGLARDGDAQPLGADLEAHAKDAVAATVGGYLCLGRDSDAQALAIKALGDDDDSSAIIDSLQPVGAQIPATASVWSEQGDRLRAMPPVMAALDKAGRVLPEALWPIPVDPWR